MAPNPAAFEFHCAFCLRRKICKTVVCRVGLSSQCQVQYEGFPRSPQRPAWQEEVSHSASLRWARSQARLCKRKTQALAQTRQLIHPVSREKNARFLSTAVLLPRKRGYGSEHPVLGCIFHISRPTRKCYDPGGWLETAAVELILLKQEEKICVFSSWRSDTCLGWYFYRTLRVCSTLHVCLRTLRASHRKRLSYVTVKHAFNVSKVNQVQLLLLCVSVRQWTCLWPGLCRHRTTPALLTHFPALVFGHYSPDTH